MAASPVQIRFFALLAASLVLGAGAVMVGVEDNPPGIVLGVGSAIALVAAFVHTWRNPRHFRWMIYASIGGAVLFAVVSTLVENASAQSSIPSALDSALNVVATAIMLLIPASLLVGIVGAALTWRLRPGGR